jgi:pantothenate kinase
MTSDDPARIDDETLREADLDELTRWSRALVVPGRRRVLGITGAPGSGKTTLAETLTVALGADAVLVSLDGFHLANAELRRLGRHARKGAPDTFDAAGYVNLLQRVKACDDAVVYAARFDRNLEESIAGAIAIAPDVPLVITEGNYLLLDGPHWGRVRALLDECWYVDPPDEVRLQRLIARHIAFGRTPEEAYERSHGSDQRNAEAIAATRERATRVVRVRTIGVPASPTLDQER